MEHPNRNKNHTTTIAARLGAAIGALLVLGMLAAAPALATLESVATFGTTPGESQVGDEPNGVAVNTTGAGGVPAGTVYAVSLRGSRVLRYSPKGEFRAAWGWGVAPKPTADEYQRCGPDGEAAYPTCGISGNGSEGGDQEGLGQPTGSINLAVDQVTGNVYVSTFREHGAIQVYSADGEPIAGFGERSRVFGESLTDSPEKIHIGSTGALAIDGSGNVYISDYTNAPFDERRVMVFSPQTPGDYEHYVYTGRANDIAAPVGALEDLALDVSGNFYAVVSEGHIYKFAEDEPDVPVCHYVVPGGGVLAMSVNPESGEVFYFSYKNRKIHQLSACDSAGKFTALSSFAPARKTEGIQALAFNPVLAYEPSRSPGILYAVDAGAALVPPRGEIFAPAEVHAPSVESESAYAVGTTTASLGASINPKGSQTRYVFQYIAAGAYAENEPADRFAGASEAPLGGSELGSGQVSLGASVSLGGLLSDTEYHYRAVASSHCNPDDEEEVCEAVGPDQAFRTFPLQEPGLPDNRAYELVSPAKKLGGEVFPINPNVWGPTCTECKPGTQSDRFPMQASPDGEAVAFEGFPFSASEGAPVFNQYVSRRTSAGWKTVNPSPALLDRGYGSYVAIDTGLTRAVIRQDRPTLSPGAPAGYANLYSQPTASSLSLTPLVEATPPNRPIDGNFNFKVAYAGGSADLSHVVFQANDALTGETPFAPAAQDGGAVMNNVYESVGGGLRLVNVLPGNAEALPGASLGSGIEKTGASVSNAVSNDGSRIFWSSEAGQVYLREDGEVTREIPGSGKFLTASTDGSRVLLDNGHIHDLDDGAPMVDLTQGQGGFQGITGQSEDLSSIYFVDTAVLSGDTENDQGDAAQPAANNLYLFRAGVTSFIATLLPVDNDPLGVGVGDWRPVPSRRLAEASPDGRWVAFLSRAPLTGHDSPGLSQAFLYDSATGALICVSCSPALLPPAGSSMLPLISRSPSASPQPRYLTNSGRLYFDTEDSLTPSDTNGAEDVYQYEPEGIGSCQREGGCVTLISAGRELNDSNFFAADQSGKNVFFTSRDQLVLKDTDDLYDLYVAREGGGIASETETARGECQGEACVPVLSPPNDPTPGSSSFKGAGNVVEKKAAKKHKKKQARKHKKKGHAKKHKSQSQKRQARANHNRGGAQ